MTQKKTIKKTLPELGILYKKDFNTLKSLKKQLDRVRSSAIVKDFTTSDFETIFRIHETYFPKIEIKNKGCNSCLYKVMLRVARLFYNYERQEQN